MRVAVAVGLVVVARLAAAQYQYYDDTDEMMDQAPDIVDVKLNFLIAQQLYMLSYIK